MESLQFTIQGISSHIEQLREEILGLEQNVLYNITTTEKLNHQLEVSNRINALLAKDFRGVLLSNVVEYIDRRAKEFSQKVFGTQEIAFTQEGNMLNVSYCGKVYETLSGGEKQRVDIIVQLSLRALLCEYMNFSTNILVLDELFDGLDSLGCERVLNIISSELQDVDNIYIITHHNDIDLPIDHILTITKNSYGISTITNDI